jgi:hypothetical protein
MNYISDLDVKNSFLEKTTFASTEFAYINAQSVHSPNEFYNTVSSAISEHLTIPLKNSPELKTGRAFQKWLDNTLRANSDLKVIVLIDEFEKLNDSGEFDMEFFGHLRALASSHPSSFTWVTASAVDLYTLDKSQKTSPFWNIFHQMPIIMGGFGADAPNLIEDSLKTIGETITDPEVNEILVLSGEIPYFIQAVADAWYNLREKQKIPLAKIKDMAFDMLSNPNNQIQHVYKDYWDQMGERRRAILKSIANEKRNLTAAYSDLISLSDFGLIRRDNGKFGGYKISGQLLQQFFIDISDDVPPSPRDPKTPENKPDSHVVVVEVDKNTHIHTEGGNYIHGNANTRGGNIMRDDKSNSGMNDTDVTKLFEGLYDTINRKTDLNNGDKVDLIAEIDDLKKELAKKGKSDEDFMMRRLRNIGRMAPDILEVTLATITNPLSGFGVVAKKIADKIKVSAK